MTVDFDRLTVDFAGLFLLSMAEAETSSEGPLNEVLPPDALLCILKYVDVKDFPNVALTCHAWHEVEQQSSEMTH